MNKKLLRVAILAVSMLLMANMALLPALAEIAKTFSDVPTSGIQTITTFPLVIEIIATLIAGKAVSYVTKKQLCNFGILCIFLAGLGGFFLHSSIVLLYIWAAVIGIGIGFLVFAVTIIIANYYNANERGAILGQQSIFISLGGIILMFCGGLLANIGWHYTYLVYSLFGLPLLIMGILGLPKQNIIYKQKGQLARFGFLPFYYAAIGMSFQFVFSVLPTNMAMFVNQMQIGSADSYPATAGYASAAMMLGGVVAGFLYSKFSQKLKDYMLCVAFALCSAGLIIVAYAHSVPVLITGAFLAGSGVSLLAPQVIYSTSISVTPAASSMAISVVMSISLLGSFFSPLIITPFADMINYDIVQIRYLLAAGFGVLMVILLAITTTVLNKRRRMGG